MISYKKFKHGDDSSQILILLEEIDKLLIEPISTRVSLDEYCKKITEKAIIILAYDEVTPVGLIAFYSNQNENSYITIIGVKKAYWNRNISSRLIDLMQEKCCAIHSTSIELECSAELLKFYLKKGFNISREVSKRNNKKFILRKELNTGSIPHYSFKETPIEALDYYSTKTGSSIYIKRDDLFPKAQGGNKARKLQYILYKAIQEGCNSIVTAGDINSNHNRATALMCAKLGLKAKLIIHNDYPELEQSSPNTYLCRLSGAEIIFCNKSDVAEVMTKAMDDFKKAGNNPFYIWGGGHCLEGSYAYYEAVKNLHNELAVVPDFVFFASGTGTTHAGLKVGFNTFYPNTKVIGISIAREAQRGITEIHKSINELELFLSKEVTPKSDIIFNDQFIGRSYESIDLEVTKVIREAALEEGLILDPTYSGKAFNGMLKLIEKDKSTYEGKSVLFWNTGGLFNLLAHKEEL